MPNSPAEISQSMQDYLKTILELSQDGQPASTSAIAERLSVASASVTSMLQKMSNAEPPFITYHKRHSVELTPHGEKAALQILRRHRLIEVFLVRDLGYTWDEVHEEAERLEHAISDRFEERLAAHLGEPAYDPHGDPIPDAQLLLPDRTLRALDELESGEQATVRRIVTKSSELLRYLGRLGIQPGVELVMCSKNPFDQTLRIELQPSRADCILGPNLGRVILVG